MMAAATALGAPGIPVGHSCLAHDPRGSTQGLAAFFQCTDTYAHCSPGVVLVQVSDSLLPRVHECYHAYDVLGSDHCPVVLVLQA